MEGNNDINSPPVANEPTTPREEVVGNLDVNPADNTVDRIRLSSNDPSQGPSSSTPQTMGARFNPTGDIPSGKSKKRNYESSDEGTSDSSLSSSEDESQDSSSNSDSSSDEGKHKKKKKRSSFKKKSKKIKKIDSFDEKLLRFKPTAKDQPSAKWKLDEDQAVYANKYSRSYIQSRIIQESILDTLPVPSNILPIAELDEYIHSSLESKNHSAVQIDDELKKIQINIRNIYGPIGRIWQQVDLMNKGASGEFDGAELAGTLEKSIVLVGKALNDITYLRRSKIMNTFNKDKRKVASVLKKHQKKFRKSKKNLFGKRFKSIIKEKIRDKQNSVDIYKAFGSNQSPNKSNFHREQPFRSGPVNNDQAGGAKIQVTTNRGKKGFSGGRSNYKSHQGKQNYQYQRKDYNR